MASSNRYLDVEIVCLDVEMMSTLGYAGVMVERDAVDALLEQWQRERPDVDTSAMAVIGRISRIERLLKIELDKVFSSFGLESWEFDVLATLRRSGAPHALTAGQLLDSMMIASGTVTNRIDRLAARGLVERRRDPDDGRVVVVALTRRGRTLIDRALPAHAANESRLLSFLGDADRQVLTDILRRMHLALSDPTPG
jgi:DNA-binding MarR family transcriptional regulator